MPVLSVDNLSKDFRNKPVFDGVTFSLDWSGRMGLIGVNGSGKTTLMRILSGEQAADSGTVSIPEGSRIGYLPQNPEFDPDESVLDAIFSKSSDALGLIHDYEAACSQLAHKPDDTALTDLITRLASQIEAAGAWEIETNAKIILSKLGITDLEATMGTLSGGQRKRVALAHALIVQPDLLMLDEPTNHLDAETISWLEQYLERYAGALLLVTHDRYFLDRVTDHILEIDRGTTHLYDGNYVWYLERKAELELNRKVEGRKRQALIRQELAWLRRGAKARRTKQKARIDRADQLMSAPKDRTEDPIDIPVLTRRLGSKVVEFENVSKGYDNKTLIRDFTYIMPPGERLGIIGPNGSGKTTLLELIAGNIQPDSGTVAIGQTVVTGYYDQESRTLNGEQRVIDYIKEIAENLPAADGGTITASQMLERFLFPPDTQYAPIGKLSGGERRRLYLLRVLMGTPNLLLLDEPTNDLDIPTLMALESYLDDFQGSLVVVSHDRYFLDRTVDHIYRLEGEGRLREYPGNYSAFLEIREREAEGEKNLTNKKKPAPPKPAAPTEKKRKLTFNERKEFQALEQQIADHEKRKQEIEQEFSAGSTDYAHIQTLSAELDTLIKSLENKFERWAELAELAEQG